MIRTATVEDIPVMEKLVEESCRSLLTKEYPLEVIEYCLKNKLWAIHKDIVEDNTYYAIEKDGKIVGCGGWSGKKKVTDVPGVKYDQVKNHLEPEEKSGLIRSFYVHPDYARHGYGRMLLEHCESEAKKKGVKRLELITTVEHGRIFYEKNNFVVKESFDYTYDINSFTKTRYLISKVLIY